MQALYFDGSLSVRDVPRPRPEPGEALSQVTYAGICGTDLQILQGYSGFHGIPGHEFVGRVIESADASWLGKRVVSEINVSCQTCKWCRRGLGRHCPNRTVMGIVNRPGAFAQFVAMPLVNLHEVPPEVTDQAAVFTEPLAAAVEILEQTSIPLSTPVAVVGSGRLGLLIGQVLHDAGAEVTMIGRNPDKLKLACSWELKTFNLAANAQEKLPARSFALVVEATGSPRGLEEALRLVEPRGTVAMKSTFRDLAQFDTARLVVDEITLLGSRCGNFARALELLRKEKVHVAPMISRTFALSEGPNAFEYLRQESCLKVLLAP